MNERIRVAIMGSGFIARTHAHSLAHGCTNAVLAGIGGGSRAEKLAADFAVPFFPSWNSSPLIRRLMLSSSPLRTANTGTTRSFARATASMCSSKNPWHPRWPTAGRSSKHSAQGVFGS